MAGAFQSNAFQNNAFQVEAGAACIPAFQPSAFQNNAFQVCPDTVTSRQPGRWHPDDAGGRRKRPVKPIIYVDEDGNPISEKGPEEKPAAQEQAAPQPLPREEIPLDLLASQLAAETQAYVAAQMQAIQDELARFLIIQQIEALRAEDARNAALVAEIIADVTARMIDDEEAMFLMASV